MKKIGLFCLVICLLTTSVCLNTQVNATPIDNAAVVSGSHSLDAGIPMLGTEQLISNARSAVLYECNTQTLMYAYNADEQMYPASLVKIMTALIAAERGVMTDAVIVTEDVLNTVPDDAVSCDLQADEVLTLQDLLYCMMVDSANDAAAVIADHISGSQELFVAEMNRYASEIGCTGTNFTNVHGLHDDQQYTTARDMARILAVAIKNETFRTVFGALDYTVPATNKSEIRNISTGNYLLTDDSALYYDSRVTGGRTGVTQQGERCIAASAGDGDLQMISILMGCESNYEQDGYSAITIGGFQETSALLDLGLDDFSVTQVLFGGQALKQYSVANGNADVVVGPQVSVQTVLPKGFTELSYRFSDTIQFSAPIAKGQNISYLEIWYGDICVAQADLFALNAVPVQQMEVVDSADSKDTGVLSTVFTVLGIIVTALLAFVVVVRLVRSLRSAAVRNRSRRYRRNRRRSR